ncbi:MAG: hypothetical protein KGH75_01545 [Rhodospirillales bacterium]|nr:hypothetical protein [Rhodospirillales bacterium]
MKPLNLNQKLALASIRHPKHTEKLKSDSNPLVVRTVASNSPEHHNYIYNRPDIKDKSMKWVRFDLAEHGNEEIKNHILHNDTDSDVINSLACRANDKFKHKMLDTPRLYHKKYELARYNIARLGNDSHRDRLIDDKGSLVRQYVANRGNENHARKLLNDPNLDVRKVAKRRLKELGVKN